MSTENVYIQHTIHLDNDAFVCVCKYRFRYHARHALPAINECNKVGDDRASVSYSVLNYSLPLVTRPATGRVYALLAFSIIIITHLWLCDCASNRISKTTGMNEFISREMCAALRCVV